MLIQQVDKNNKIRNYIKRFNAQNAKNTHKTTKILQK